MSLQPSTPELGRGLAQGIQPRSGDLPYLTEPASSHGLTLHVVRAQQQAFFESGATRSYEFRVQQLQRLRTAIKVYEPRIIEALRRDLQKSATESFLSEIGFLYDEIRHTLAHLKGWMEPERVKTPLPLVPGRSEILREPLGQILIISPWNYPFQLVMGPVIAAMAAGNTLVLKPSEHSTATAQTIAQLVKDYFSPEYMAVFEGGVDVSQALLDQPWHHIFFTGSTAIGSIVAQAAARFLTPVTLELGGKSPVIVDATANIEIAARRIVFGKFVNCGQTCIAPDYILVHSSQRDSLVEALKHELNRTYGADPQTSDSFGRIIHQRHFDRLVRLMQDGRKVHGGRVDRDDRYIEPTLYVDIRPEDAIMQEEIFGPLLPILTFDSYDDILYQVRRNSHPLALYVFSEDRSLQERILRDIPFGGGAINDTVLHFMNPHMPFGGIGASGQGASHGIDGFLRFTHRKSLYRNTTWIDLPIRYAPYTPWKVSLFRLLMDREESFGRLASLALLSLFFVAAGLTHFTHPDLFLKMMPPAIPAPALMVLLSGIAEIVLGLLVLVRRWRPLAAWGLIALLIAVFPANVHMAANPELFPSIPAWALWARLPFQLVFVAWAYSFTHKRAS